ncbi:unnamed protein product, partial [Vitis vinifera]
MFAFRLNFEQTKFIKLFRNFVMGRLPETVVEAKRRRFEVVERPPSWDRSTEVVEKCDAVFDCDWTVRVFSGGDG